MLKDSNFIEKFSIQYENNLFIILLPTFLQGQFVGIETQGEVDSFEINYPGVSGLNNLTIEGLGVEFLNIYQRTGLIMRVRFIGDMR